MPPGPHVGRWGSLGAVIEIKLLTWVGSDTVLWPILCNGYLCALCGPHVKGLGFGKLGPKKTYLQTGQLFLGI